MKFKSYKRGTPQENSFRSMPRLRHSNGVPPWTMDQSDVFRWMSQNKAIMEHAMQQAYSRGWIEFDQATKTWRGVP